MKERSREEGFIKMKDFSFWIFNYKFKFWKKYYYYIVTTKEIEIENWK